jgi:hypothetical protein
MNIQDADPDSVKTDPRHYSSLQFLIFMSTYRFPMLGLTSMFLSPLKDDRM